MVYYLDSWSGLVWPGLAGVGSSSLLVAYLPTYLLPTYLLPTHLLLLGKVQRYWLLFVGWLAGWLVVVTVLGLTAGREMLIWRL